MKNADKNSALTSQASTFQSAIKCSHCDTYWSDRQEDYVGMRENDPLYCSCGELLCFVGELKKEDTCDWFDL